MDIKSEIKSYKKDIVDLEKMLKRQKMFKDNPLKDLIIKKINKEIESIKDLINTLEKDGGKK